VLDIVPPDKDKSPPPVDGSCVDNGKPRLASACGGGSKPIGSKPANQIDRATDQGEHDQKGEKKPRGKRHLRAEQGFEHHSTSALDLTDCY
jgi:hypothetical protein